MAGTPRKPGASTARGGKGKLILIVAATVVLLLGAGAGAYFLGFVGGGRPASAAAQKDARGEATGQGEGEVAVPAVAFVDLPDMIVNLQSDGGRPRYLRLKLAIEVPDDPTATAVRALMPRVLDSFQMFLRSLTVSDVQGSPGMMRLKEEMLARVNLATEPARIRDVLFKEILVQ